MTYRNFTVIFQTVTISFFCNSDFIPQFDFIFLNCYFVSRIFTIFKNLNISAIPTFSSYSNYDFIPPFDILFHNCNFIFNSTITIFIVL